MESLVTSVTAGGIVDVDGGSEWAYHWLITSNVGADMPAQPSTGLNVTAGFNAADLTESGVTLT
jgi:hypothetical protein